jgi:hypothetical protein
MTLEPFLRAPNRLLPNLPANTDAQMRPLPSVAPGFVRRLPLR